MYYGRVSFKDKDQLPKAILEMSEEQQETAVLPDSLFSACSSFLPPQVHNSRHTSSGMGASGRDGVHCWTNAIQTPTSLWTYRYLGQTIKLANRILMASTAKERRENESRIAFRTSE